MARRKAKSVTNADGNVEVKSSASVPTKRKPGRPKGSKNKNPPKKGGSGKRGRKAIFTDAQKKLLDRMIRTSLKAELRALVRAN